MKHRKVNYMTFVIAGGLFACSAISEDKPATADSKTSKEDMMKKVEAAATPGPAHKALESLAGDWNAEGKCWASPDGSPTTSKGVSKVHWVLGGRFLQEDFSGEYMGKSFRGMGLTGYDNLKKKYVSSWVDDMSTGLFTTEGTADAAGKVFTFRGTMDDPITGQTDKPVKLVINVIDPDRHTFEVHDLTKGEKSKVMEMTYTRIASPTGRSANQ
jgi:hypothetical protein